MITGSYRTSVETAALQVNTPERREAARRAIMMPERYVGMGSALDLPWKNPWENPMGNPMGFDPMVDHEFHSVNPHGLVIGDSGIPGFRMVPL